VIGRLLLALLVLLAPVAARAEGLVTSVSTPRVAIKSNFAGAEIVVFGSIQRADALTPTQGPYDVVIIVRGPRASIDVREKGRMAGIWVNKTRRRFADAPTFLAIQSTRAVDVFATPQMIEEYRMSLPLGVDVGPPAQARAPDPFREALVRLKRSQNLYQEAPNGVVFLSDTLFRTTIPLPPNVPLGGFEVETRLFGQGQMIAAQRNRLEVYKTGFEEAVAELAREQSFVYALATCFMAVAMGWLATVIFRRD
jgi:uncharacterized protein (TIGR02186 family)